MIDPDLERRYSECVQLVDAWKEFLDLVNMAIKGDAAINEKHEDQFLQNKATIAMLHDGFTDSLKHDKSTGQTMIDLVNRSISLKFLRKALEAEQKKIVVEWHEVFLLLNETVTTLQERREMLANRNEFLWKLGKFKDRTITRIYNFLFSIYFKTFAGLVVFIFIIWGVPAFGIYDWDELRDVEFLETPFSYFFMTGRFLGLNAPYHTIGDYNAALEGLDKDELKGQQLKKLSGDKARAIASIRGKIDPTLNPSQQQDLADALEKAENYQGWETRGGSNVAEGHIFWFRTNKEAKQLELDWFAGKEDQLADDFEVIRKANVLTIVWAYNTGGNRGSAIGHLNNAVDIVFDSPLP